ncbi:3034_t:CDS:2, partial [Ambispora gerdemannii]
GSLSSENASAFRSSLEILLYFVKRIAIDNDDMLMTGYINNSSISKDKFSKRELIEDKVWSSQKAMTSPLVSYVYKILVSTALASSTEKLPLPALDHQDGFIHLSTAHQVPATAARFFSNDNLIKVLRVPYVGRIKEGVKWEKGIPSSTELFPHLYGVELTWDDVEEVVEVVNSRSEGYVFPEGWLKF